MRSNDKETKSRTMVKRGIISPSDGLEVAARSRAGGAEPFKGQLAAALSHIREALVSCRYPPSAKLHVISLAEEHGVSPGAVREALSQLVSDGLVTFADQRGFRASPISIEALKDITRVKLLVDSSAIASAIELGDAAWEGDILAAFHRLGRTLQHAEDGGTSLQWVAEHRSFHRALIASCDSPWLLRLHDLLFDQSERYRQFRLRTQVSGRAIRDVESEHRRIMDAVLLRDRDRAVRELSDHYMRTAEMIIISLQGDA